MSVRIETVNQKKAQQAALVAAHMYEPVRAHVVAG